MNASEQPFGPLLGCDWLGYHALRVPDATAAVFLPERIGYSYRQLAEASRSLTQGLKQQGLQPGDRLALLADNHPASLVLLSSCQQLGALLVPLNTRLAPAELRQQLEMTRPKRVFLSNEWRELASAVSPALPTEPLLDVLTEKSVSPEPDSAPWSADHPLMLLFTSGSTGKPKAVIYTHGMLHANARNTVERFRLTAADSSLHLMPGFHTGGWHVLPTPTLFAGGGIHILPRFDAPEVIRSLQHPDVRLAMLVPTMCRILAEHPAFSAAEFRHLRFLVVGGEALPLDLISTWHTKGVALRQGYGLTEAGPGITSLEAEDTLRKRGSIGTPNRLLSYRIVDSSGDECPTSKPGELQLAGPVVTPGYWENPEATAAAFTPDGWLKTGDIVRMDSEGYLYVVDRLKHMYISGGENVYPAEVENALRSYPGLSDLAIVSVADNRWGEVGLAAIVPNPSAPFDWEAFLAWAQTQIARYKLPKRYRLLEALPTTATGKVDRNALRQQIG